jgi:hypothetical protein
MSVKNSNDLGTRLLSILQQKAAIKREISMDSLDYHNDKTFKLSDITDLYVDATKQNKKLDFSPDLDKIEAVSLSNESIVINKGSNDYGDILTSIFDISDDSDLSLSEVNMSMCKKATVIMQPRQIGTPNPQLATFHRTIPSENNKATNVSEITVGGPTMPTEGDAFEMDLDTERHKDMFSYEAQVHKTLFNTKIGTLPCRIYCAVCRCAVMSAVGAE